MATSKKDQMIKLSWWEEFIVTAAISLLTMLQSKITNQVELAGLQAAIGFLQKLLGGNVPLADPAQSTTGILD